MSRFRGRRGLTIGTTLLALLWAVGCAPPGGLQSGDSTPQADQNPVPFHDGNARPSRRGDSSTAQDKGPQAETDLPFQDSQNLPAGTLLTVRLKNPISVEDPDANGTFEAVVDQPVVIEGSKLLPLGAAVSGRVESARASNLKRNRGYLRLTLESIHLAGLDVPVQTSSLFVRGNAGLTQEASTPVIQLEKGRRLVFRLTEPVYVAVSQRAPASH
ncbi:MAG: hypothetical protein ABR881_16830 [Candidatus Sulfotelmatobacter sp.]